MGVGGQSSSLVDALFNIVLLVFIAGLGEAQQINDGEAMSVNSTAAVGVA